MARVFESKPFSHDRSEEIEGHLGKTLGSWLSWQHATHQALPPEQCVEVYEPSIDLQEAGLDWQAIEQDYERLSQACDIPGFFQVVSAPRIVRLADLAEQICGSVLSLMAQGPASAGITFSAAPAGVGFEGLDVMKWDGPRFAIFPPPVGEIESWAHPGWTLRADCGGVSASRFWAAAKKRAAGKKAFSALHKNMEGLVGERWKAPEHRLKFTHSLYLVIEAETLEDIQAGVRDILRVWESAFGEDAELCVDADDQIGCRIVHDVLGFTISRAELQRPIVGSVPKLFKNRREVLRSELIRWSTANLPIGTEADGPVAWLFSFETSRGQLKLTAKASRGIDEEAAREMLQERFGLEFDAVE